MKTNLGDQLVIFCYTTTPVNLEISGLTRDNAGEIRAFGPELWYIDGVVEGFIEGEENVKVVPALIDGELLAVNVSTPDRNLQAGECYIRGAIRTQMYDTPRAVLFGDYIALPSPLSFPGSPVVSALGGPGLYRHVDLEDGVAFDVPSNARIKILSIFASAQGTGAGDITFELEIQPQLDAIAYYNESKMAVLDDEELVTVNYFPGAGSIDAMCRTIPIPDNFLIPTGKVTVWLGGVLATGTESIQMEYMQWIYPFGLT